MVLGISIRSRQPLEVLLETMGAGSFGLSQPTSATALSLGRN
ncbi:hypothetical protein LINPERPRIM_LOCUS31914 [Linum perenne]